MRVVLSIFIFLFLVLSKVVFAQKDSKLGTSQTSREVSGIVLDSLNNPLPSAIITLHSELDTLKTNTNDEGIFIFKQVRSANFHLTASAIGFLSQTRRLLNNLATRTVVLDPIILLDKSHQLKEVTVLGTPSITYKTDTVEYRAADYKVREYANVDELLKKMEGMEVGRDGSLVHLGQEVTQARLNGKNYAGGDVATVIQGLPADIVEKIQIVDDYGDQANRTGIKDGPAKKVLNITTKADRSVGNTAKIEVGAGNQNRYEAKVFVSRINANRTSTLTGGISNTITGIASTDNTKPPSGPESNNSNAANSPGRIRLNNPSYNYRDNLGKHFEINLNYSYVSKNQISESNSRVQLFNQLGTTFIGEISESLNKSRNHNVSIEIDFNIDSLNFLRFTPSINFINLDGSSQSLINQAGLINQQQTSNRNLTLQTPAINGTLFFQHYFKRKGRNFTIQFGAGSINQKNDAGTATQILYYDNNAQQILKDSLINLFIANRNKNDYFRGSTTFSEPIGKLGTLQINIQSTVKSYDNNKQSSLQSAGVLLPIDSLSSLFNYRFTETRISGSYRLSRPNYNFSLGMTAIPMALNGANQGPGALNYRSSFKLIPITRFLYQWSRQHQFQFSYSGAPLEPSFMQLQPVRDLSNPQNPIIGNPELAITFRHTGSLNYNNYLANSKINYSISFNATKVDNVVVRNFVIIPDNYQNLKYETRYENSNGNYNLVSNYSISKQLENRAYNLTLNGLISKTRGLSMSNSVKNFISTWRFNQRFGPRLAPSDNIEINPFISYDLTKSKNSIPSSFNSRVEITSLNIDGRVFLNQRINFGYSLSKNFVTGIDENISKNPFVVNGYIETKLFKRKNGYLRLQAFDILNQNNFINRTISENTITDRQTNILSRYFMVNFAINLQKWSGSPKRNGNDLKRRGDGSFYE